MSWHLATIEHGLDWGAFAAILSLLAGILLAGLRGVFHLGQLAKDKEQRDKQVDDHEERIGTVEVTVQEHSWRLKRVDPAGEGPAPA